MSASLPFVGRGMQEAAELHQKLQDIHTLSRTGTADLRPTPKALRLVLRARRRSIGSARRSSTDPSSLQSSAKSAEAGVSLSGRAPKPRACRTWSSGKATQEEEEEVGHGLPANVDWMHELKTRNLAKLGMPTISELPERRTPSTTEESGASDADDIDEGSDDEFDSLNFAEVPEDGLPAAPPVAGSVCATPSRQYIGTVTAT
ncbi:unnamed protein product [Effrenium voratum]|nr:unnamed protein product [Effrenium voratum]